MLLGFYKVNNKLGYGRNAFNNVYDEPDTILEMLRKLPEEEYKVYDLSTTDTNVMHYTLGDFVEDYNDEILDDGWWSVIIP